MTMLLDWMLPDAAYRTKALELYGSNDFPNNRKRFRRFFRDSLFSCSTREMSESWSKAGVPVHTYVMSFDYKQWGALKSWGTAHALELVFTWRNGVNFWGKLRFDRQTYRTMSDLMACTWASFVWCHAPKCSTPPKHCEVPLQSMPTWPSFNVSDMKYISLKEQPTIEMVPNHASFGQDEFPGEDRCNFWKTANMDWQSIRHKNVELV